MEQNVIKVRFFNPVDGQIEYYFGSIAAMFERFTEEQIGCSQQAMWYHKLKPDKPKATKKCIITKHPIFRKPQKKKKL